MDIHLFLMRSPDQDTLKRCAPGAQVQPVEEGFEARWFDLRVTLERLGSDSAAEVRRHLAGFGCPQELADRVGESGVVLAIAPGPGSDLSGRPERLIRELSRELEGLIASERFILDGDGRVLFGAPPDPDRVVRRALALSAVVYRGYIEEFAAAAFQDAHHDALAWIRLYGFEQELEGYELRLVRASQREPHRQEIVNATWRAEGLVVLAWALGILETLPELERPVHPKGISASIGFLLPELPPEAARPRLRSGEELERQRSRIWGFYRRLRSFSLDRKPVDFRAAGQELDLPLADGDLAIGGVPLSQVSAEDFGRCMSIAQERALAIAWVMGAHPLYSVVPLPPDGPPSS
ncbi:MAG: DUF4272 domain-containing protein [Armatimonadetes bacterium]|nr:DUF4272 domain-containing protein [Armatimonadota bacterium]